MNPLPKPSAPSSLAGAAEGLWFNPHVAALPVYNAGLSVSAARAISGHQDIARLGSNENPHGCSPDVLRALSGAAFEPWRYSDPVCTDLRAALSRHTGVPAQEIVVGNGSEEMIAAVSRAFLTVDSTAVTVVPSFGLHEIEPLAIGAKVIKVPMTADMGFDVAGLERALAAKPQILLLSSPWNPVGSALSLEDLMRIAKACSPSTLFMLDEAYFEFAAPDVPNGIEVLRASGIAHVVLRSFSKAYGLAGLRVGFAACSNPEIARVVAAAKTPFNVNLAAQIGAIAALGDDAWMKDTVQRIRAERERTRAGLTAIGLKPAPSYANHLFFDCGTDAGDLGIKLLQDGIIVKAWRERGYETFLRASTGLPQENDRIVASLKKHLNR